MLSTHSLSIASFDELASGGGNTHVVKQLAAVSRSRHLVLLRSVLEISTNRMIASGPLPSLDSAWDLLVAAERSDRAAVDLVLTHPNVAVWATYALRRLKGLVADETPLWATLGHLHNIAVAAAIRARVGFYASVVVRDGEVALPTLGLARLAAGERWRAVPVHRAAVEDAVRLPGVDLVDLTEDTDGWRAMTRLRAGSRQVWLDVLDPYRGFAGPLPPIRLPDNEVRQWRTRLAETWALLQRVHPIAAAELAVGLSVLVPATERDQTIPYSASSREAFGSVALSLPIGRAQFAATLVHEFAHSKLSCLMNLVELYERDEEPRFYAPWRDDPRPLGGMLQGTYSYLAITDFWRRHRIHSNGEDQEVAYFHFALARAQATQAARALADDPKLTSLGQRFVSKMLDRLDSWQADPVPADILAKAARASAEHRARWRPRNLQPSAE